MYPKNDPHWVKADRVVAVTSFHVNVWVNGVKYGPVLRQWNDPSFDKTKGDVLVEDPEAGWLRVWFYDAEIG